MVWTALARAGLWTARVPSALRLRHDADIGLRRLPALRPDLLGVVVAHRARDDDVVALLPVHRRRDLVLGGQLQRVDDAQHLVEVAPGGHRIDQDQLDLLVRPDHEYVAHRLVVAGRALQSVTLGGTPPPTLAPRH